FLFDTVFDGVVQDTGNYHVFAYSCTRQNQPHDQLMRYIRDVLSFALLLLVHLMGLYRKSNRLLYLLAIDHLRHYIILTSSRESANDACPRLASLLRQLGYCWSSAGTCAAFSYLSSHAEGTGHLTFSSVVVLMFPMNITTHYIFGTPTL